MTRKPIEASGQDAERLDGEATKAVVGAADAPNPCSTTTFGEETARELLARVEKAADHYRCNQDCYEIRLPRSCFAGRDDHAPALTVGDLRAILSALDPPPTEGREGVEAEAIELMREASRHAGKKLNDWVGGILQEAAQKAAATPPMRDREAIARIIDPGVWTRRDWDATRREEWDKNIHLGWGISFEEWVERGTADSLALADQILSLSPSPCDCLVREALERFVKLERRVLADLKTAHSLRGPGASSEMRADDRDDYAEAVVAFEAARTALQGQTGGEGK